MAALISAHLLQDWHLANMGTMTRDTSSQSVSWNFPRGDLIVGLVDRQPGYWHPFDSFGP